MDKRTVFRRTAEGQDEIRTRKRGLEHNHRFALIMIDGGSDVAQLEAKSAGRWDTESLLQDLWDQGLIEPVSTRQGNGASPEKARDERATGQPAATGPGGAEAEETTPPLAEGSSPRPEAVRELLEEGIKDEMIAVVRAIMGEHGGEKLIAKIQASEESPSALADAVDSGCIFIQLTVSESKATALKERLHEILNEKYERSLFKGFFSRK